ncbi:MAG: amidophosphoribosyltransferase [Dehalococcoidia bacterium]
MTTNNRFPDLESDVPHEECGIVGVYLPSSAESDASRVAFFGIYALQHRGQESAGIAAGDGRTLRNFTNVGLVSNAFRQEDLDRLPGYLAIGHTRYSTTGSTGARNAQPIMSKSPSVELALGHNGNVINAMELRDRLNEEFGVTCTTGTDSEVIAHLLAWAPGDTWGEKSAYLMKSLKGAYSLVACTKDTLVGIRDPHGVRPMCLGRYPNGGWIIASESTAIDHIGAQFVREIAPGETVVIDRDGLTSIPSPVPDARVAHCVFEHIYFARPDSILDGHLTHKSREEMGRMLARQHPVEADWVIPIPDSANSAAVGYAQESGIPFEYGLIKNRYVGRTFIEPDQRFRDLGVRNKFNPLPEVLMGKRVVVVDDSIVRGTTTPHIVSLLRKAGASEVHVRVCAPPIRHPCHFGVDMATKDEFIATDRSVEEICELLGADTLGYLSVENLHLSINGDSSGAGFCNACFTGEYPIPVQLQLDKLSLERLNTQPTE